MLCRLGREPERAFIVTRLFEPGKRFAVWILGNFLFISLILDYSIGWVACSESPNLIHSCLICC